jgi:hypothetical protein
MESKRSTSKPTSALPPMPRIPGHSESNQTDKVPDLQTYTTSTGKTKSEPSERVNTRKKVKPIYDDILPLMKDT